VKVFDLSGKVALVTGGNGGIGLGMAGGLAAAEAQRKARGHRVLARRARLPYGRQFRHRRRLHDLLT
jgi:NAD(P)-dependent dehydrogenase (short-subunit alcohol dehydrogenase family)